MPEATKDVLAVPTATGIDIELPVAGPGARSYAFVIDWHIRALISSAWLALGTFASAYAIADTDSGLFVYAFGLPAAALYLFYHPVLEVLMDGRTPGKRMAGVRIVTTDGEAPTTAAHLIRNFFRVIDQLPTGYAVGLAATLLTQRATRIGDLAAGTLLVYETEVSDRALTELGARADRIGLQQAELVGDLLDRWDELLPDQREQMARTLLDKLGQSPAATDPTALREQLRQVIA